jgi:hypothetical protein
VEVKLTGVLSSDVSYQETGILVRCVTGADCRHETTSDGGLRAWSITWARSKACLRTPLQPWGLAKRAFSWMASATAIYPLRQRRAGHGNHMGRPWHQILRLGALQANYYLGYTAIFAGQSGLVALMSCSAS